MRRTAGLYRLPRAENRHADSLAYIASMLGESEARTIPIEFQPEPSIANRPHAEAFPVTQDLGPSWMDPYIRYLRDGELPDDRREAAKIRQKAGKYILIDRRRTLSNVLWRTSPQVPSPRPGRAGYGRNTRRGMRESLGRKVFGA